MTRPRTGYPFLDEGIDQPRSVLAFAHRGGALHPQIQGLENTLVAFQHAFDLGYRYLETDVHVTRDGTLLAFHDSVLDRVSEQRGRIADRTVEQVAEVLVGGREQIPTLPSLFERFPEARFNIDVKSEAAVAPLADLVASTNARDRVCVGAFTERRIQAFRRAAGPRVATAASSRDVVLARFAPSSRLGGVLNAHQAAALQIPHRRGPLRVVTSGLVARAHRRGAHVHVWTVDDPSEMHELLDLGVDGLMTDRTDLLRDVLVERGQWMVVGR